MKNNRIKTNKKALGVESTTDCENLNDSKDVTMDNSVADASDKIESDKNQKRNCNSKDKLKGKNKKPAKGVHKNRKILVVVDVQNDFITGCLGNKECVVAEQRICERLQAEADKFNAIYFTKDVHYDNYLETLEGKKLPIEHCIYGTKGCDFTDGIKDAMATLRKNGKYVKVVTKHTFGSSILADILSVTCGGNDEIELCGVCTDICVVSNALALRQMMPNRVIKVNPSFCAGTSRAAHKAALRTMNSCQIEIVAGGNY